MRYDNLHIGYFLERPNRFIAWCELNGQVVKTHVKNTGRGKEVLIPHAVVALVHSDVPTRKTAWDLVAVMKNGQWINIDSQAPNVVAYQGIIDEQIKLPHLHGQITDLKREVTFEDARFDIYGMTNQTQPFFVEVKGVTLEHAGFAAFPDAPTSRGAKHVETLIRAQAAGYQAYLCFIVQMPFVTAMTVYQQRDPRLFDAVTRAMQKGVQIIAYTCKVTPQELIIAHQLPVTMKREFIED